MSTADMMPPLKDKLSIAMASADDTKKAKRIENLRLTIKKDHKTIATGDGIKLAVLSTVIAGTLQEFEVGTENTKIEIELRREYI